MEGVGKAAVAGPTGSVTLIVCEALETFPQASVAVQVLVMEYEPAQAPLVVTSAEVKVKAEPQASVAVATANTGVAEQLMVEGAGKAAMTGATVSVTLIVCEALETFPQASVAVQVLVTEYEPAQAPLVVTSAEVKVKAEPQASVAVATANTGVAGQEMVEVSGKAAITGAVTSLLLIV